MKVRFLISAVALFASIEALAATPQVEQFSRQLPIDATGTIWLNNPYGSIDVVGTDDDKFTISVQRQITAMDEQSLKEAREAVIITFEGDARVRVVKTRFPEPRDPRWVAICNYFVRVPRSVNVKIGGRAMDHIRLTQLAGKVTVSAFSGTIILSNVSGASTVDTVNGRVIYDYAQRPTANMNVQVINADIDIYAPRESAFEWVAESLNGDLLTNFFDIRGLFHGKIFRGRWNGSGVVPTLTTQTVSGKVTLLARGTAPAEARRIVAVASQGRSIASVSALPMPAPPATPNLQTIKKFQVPIIYMQNWQFVTNVMDVAVGEVHGNARVQTGAGEVELGVVFGTCEVDSGGGPLTLGDLMGPIDVHTDAGDVGIRAARQGGTASTDGGIVRVGYAGGPMNLRSGGGDIVVLQAAAPIDAATRSGDVSITMSPTMKTNRVTAKTSQGNVTLIVTPTFAADIDATLLTDDADSNRIRSDFNLTISREVSNGKTRLHATGKINGGGDRIELFAEDGSINISSQAIGASTLPRR
jgi:DUF4097 and DUF4098 domain-containing protein YvlB